MPTERKRCSICRGTSFSFFAQATYWQTIPLFFVSCRGCGLIFADPMPGMEVVSKGNIALNLLHESRGTISQYRGGKEYAFFLTGKKRQGVILDVGCAEGPFLKGVADHSGWSVEGLEIIPAVIAFARDVHKIKVHEGALEDLDGRDGYYDHLRMNNVIEHVQDPLRFLEKAYRVLKKGGTVYCSTPNGVQDGSVLKVANRKSFKVNLLENHFHYYPPKTLRCLFLQCGFRITHAYSEDVSHTLRDFGFLPGIRRSPEIPEHGLDHYETAQKNNFTMSEEDIRSFANHPSMKTWKVLLRAYKKKIFRLRFPYFIPLGHQQHVYAVKEL